MTVLMIKRLKTSFFLTAYSLLRADASDKYDGCKTAVVFNPDTV